MGVFQTLHTKNLSRRNLGIGFFLLVGLLAISLFAWYPLSEQPTYPVLEKEIDGNSMEPLIPNGSKVQLLVGYYANHLPKRGDIIAYDYGGNQHPLIKVIRAVPGDRIDIDTDRKTIRINGEYLTNSIGDSYIFTHGELEMLKLYAKDGTLTPGGYFVFGDNVTNSIDSRKFGAIAPENFYGKFILKP